MPLSGATATAGKYQLEGMQLCADYVNEHGGIESMGGAKLELVVSDTTGKVEVGMTEMERLVSVEKVSAVVGPYNSTVGAATAPIAIQYKIPYVITNAVADNIMQSGANKYVYRANYGGYDMTPFRGMVAEYLGSLKAEKKLSKIAILYDAGDWGTSELKSWTSVAEKIGAKIVVSEAITTNSSDLSSVVNKVKASKADLVVAGIFLNDALQFTQQMREYKCEVPILGSGTGFSAYEWLQNIGPEKAEGVLATADFNPSFGVKNDEAKAFYESYLKNHDGKFMPLETSNGWCGMGTLIEAIKAAGSSDREAIAGALAKTDLGADSFPLWFSMFDGIKFNTAGDSQGRFNQNERLGATAGNVMTQVIDGKKQLVFPTEKATAQIKFK
jgi:branched-chain amino acid transport system substrate-binding protein